MPEDVTVGVGMDAKKFEQESDKVQARMAKLEARNAELNQRSKRGAEDNAQAFAKWGLQIAGITSVASLATSALNVMVEQGQKIRALQDSIAIKTQQNENTVFKELRAFTPEKRKALSEKMSQAQYDTGASAEIVSGVYSDLGQNGNKLADVLGGKFDALLRLAVATGVKDSGSLVDTVNASFVRDRKFKGKNFVPNQQDYEERSSLLGTLGKDLPEATQLIAKLSANITTEHGVALFEALKDRFGTAREATKHLTGKETESQILKLANESPESFEQRLDYNRKFAKSDFEGKLAIERGSIADTKNKNEVLSKQTFGGKEITEEDRQTFNERYNFDNYKSFDKQIQVILFRKIAKMFGASEDSAQSFAEQGIANKDKDGKVRPAQEIREREFQEFIKSETLKSYNESMNKAVDKSEDSKVNHK